MILTGSFEVKVIEFVEENRLELEKNVFFFFFFFFLKKKTQLKLQKKQFFSCRRDGHCFLFFVLFKSVFFAPDEVDTGIITSGKATRVVEIYNEALCGRFGTNKLLMIADVDDVKI